MLISKKTLAVLIPEITHVSNNEICEKLQQIGIEVEAIRAFKNPDYLQLGILRAVTPHPHDNHLYVCQVQIDKNKQLNVVTGAVNIVDPNNLNKHVIVAKKGAELLNGLIIKTKNIKGIISDGMLCSYVDINPFSKHLIADGDDTHAIVLDNINRDEFGDYLSFLNLDDVVFEVTLPTNRSDLQSLIFLAKELAAVLKRPVFLEQKTTMTLREFYRFPLNLRNRAQANFFGGLFLRYVAITSSPWTTKGLLINQELRPVNCFVDQANMVTVYTGQPIHCHDADKIHGSVELKLATQLETMLALDNKEYEIKPGDLVVADEQGTIAIVGIIGSKRTMVDNTTNNIFFEVVNYNHERIKQTAQRLGVANFASRLMSKPISLQATENCLNYLQNNFLNPESIGKISKFSSTIKAPAFNRKIYLNFNQLRELIGVTKKQLNDHMIRNYLTSLGFKMENQIARAPAYRQDITVWQDISEELLKILDLNKIKEDEILSSTKLEKHEKLNAYDALQKLRTKLQTLGFHNVITYQLISPERARNFNLFGLSNLWEIKNPLSNERSVLRVGLIDSLLRVIQKNAAYKNKLGNIFEFSFVKTKDSNQLHIAALWLEKMFGSTYQKDQGVSVDIPAMKGLAQLIISNFGFNCDFEPITEGEYFTKNVGLKLVVFNEQIGYVGLIKDELLAPYDLKGRPVYGLEINLDRLLNSLNRLERSYTPISKLQDVFKDITFSFPRDESHFETFVKAIKKLQTIFKWELISVFDTEKDGVPITKYTVRYYLKNFTNTPLTLEQIKAVETQLKQQCELAKIALDL
ncbi:phenylalanine--tRNA ligase subunit beta [Mycoplasmoides pneumoniae]|uniref:phenylalanine--tRNA ligase subunit beta n=1 Tax=Mycoplasmoides pneumoniae TaxID=2104 RepID=UPI0006A6F075|nr:phenylalanine--tRNA ligase subunit beta [Mycoplasmoides pneumoniae]ALA33505.1 phenylalanyl-tRNA synthetase subunit beta [Mycoplasmoides pneumoniae 54524]